MDEAGMNKVYLGKLNWSTGVRKMAAGDETGKAGGGRLWEAFDSTSRSLNWVWSGMGGRERFLRGE